MPKFYGKIGFVTTEENPIGSGIWIPSIIERDYYGEVIQNSKRYNASESINDNVSINSQISIIGDPFINSNLNSIKYVIYMGIKWKISSIDIQSHRLILSLGDIYNG